ncbi:hypothetical protein BCR34DRAFT_628848 [Clohesyomyces aquaticus]|uniref:DUF7732 domain-containing protein n=1 Tax=Clohesyomyces aquaticus TaxID=1231657 RepID=A0A1Y1YEJ7_9PLEO|nr:hypothetical protein BCR34DRAFT_628848 [Clohesyomyces aquaticus]
MKLSRFVAGIFLTASTIKAASLPETNALALLEGHAASAPRSENILSAEHALEKRKGGGGKGGGGGGGDSWTHANNSTGGGKSGGGGGGGRSSNSGGQTVSGSGAPRSYGRGGYYGGGAGVPYSAGQKTPKGLIAGAVLLPVAALAFFPGIWLYSVYPYYLHPYRFLNQTVQNATNGVNQTLQTICLCQQYGVCGCDDNDDQSYLNDLVGNGSYAALNKSLVNIYDNGTRYLTINGTLDNDTTAPGGTDSAATGSSIPYTGYWLTGALFLYAVAFL